jgi:NAD(P)H-hydrate epimerase
VTATSEGFASVNTTGGPALGTAGTGDVLTGVVAALIGQGVSAIEAGALGAWLHGAAGDRIALEQGDAGLLAGELADALPATLHDLREAAPHVPSRAPASSLLLDFPGA